MATIQDLVTAIQTTDAIIVGAGSGRSTAPLQLIAPIGSKRMINARMTFNYSTPSFKLVIKK